MIRLILSALCLFSAANLYSEDYVRYVDPFIGTGGHGHTYPGATLPFSFVQLSPDNGVSGWDWCSGYHYSSDRIKGFSHTHLSGTGCPELGDILITPVNEDFDFNDDCSSGFCHEDEAAQPGFYSVRLESGINVELTVTELCGFHRYFYPESGKAFLKFDLEHGNGDWNPNGYIELLPDSTIVGYRFADGWANDQGVYFAARIDTEIDTFQTFADGIADGNYGKKLYAKVGFFVAEDKPVVLKVALSSASIDGAVAALEDCRYDTFDEVRETACRKWNEYLSRIKVDFATEREKKIFYTALYHTAMAPNRFDDFNNEYRGVDGKIYKAAGTYTTHSLWDTFRAQIPLLTLVNPDIVEPMVNSFLEYYKSSGLLPVWDLYFKETYRNMAYHSAVVIAEALNKGFVGFDVELAFEALCKSADNSHPAALWYRKSGFIPQDIFHESVTQTLECAYEDRCIAYVAEHLGKEEKCRYYRERSENWRNVYNESGFAAPKDSTGNFIQPFDPYNPHDPDGARAYIEGNSWQYSWFVPHDIHSLIDVMGGKENFSNRLDSLFNAGESTGPVINDMTGMIGQYVHGNEPSHHIPYLYNYVGQPWKTAEKVRKIARSLYDDSVDGICGNEDCGQMSAWYVFSVLGFYPVDPASGMYMIGSPMCRSACLNIGGKELKISVYGCGENDIYVRKVLLNGKKYDKNYLMHSDLTGGGNLEFFMGPEPSGWGTSQLPSQIF